MFYNYKNGHVTIVNMFLFVKWLNAQPFIRRSIGKCTSFANQNAPNSVLPFSGTNSSSIIHSATSTDTSSLDVGGHNEHSIIPKAKQRRLQPNPTWLPSSNQANAANTANILLTVHPPKLVIHDFLGHFQPICFVFDTRRAPHNVSTVY